MYDTTGKLSIHSKHIRMVVRSLDVSSILKQSITSGCGKSVRTDNVIMTGPL